LVPWDHRGAGTTLGRNAKAGNGEMPVDRRVVGAIEAFEFLARHLRTDKVILLAESMGTLPAVSLVKRRPDPTRWPGAWNANMAWAFRATCRRRSWTAGCSSRAWRSALPQRQGG
jgi:pimeloyl-ACP methyl ester carboxylesterase